MNRMIFYDESGEMPDPELVKEILSKPIEADKEVDIILRKLVGALGRDAIDAKTALLAWRDKAVAEARRDEREKWVPHPKDEESLIRSK